MKIIYLVLILVSTSSLADGLPIEKERADSKLSILQQKQYIKKKKTIEKLFIHKIQKNWQKPEHIPNEQQIDAKIFLNDDGTISHILYSGDINSDLQNSVQKAVFQSAPFKAQKYPNVKVSEINTTFFAK